MPWPGLQDNRSPSVRNVSCLKSNQRRNRYVVRLRSPPEVGFYTHDLFNATFGLVALANLGYKVFVQMMAGEIERFVRFARDDSP